MQTKKSPTKKTHKAKPSVTKSKPKSTSTAPASKPEIATSSTLIIDNGGWEIKYGLFPSAHSDANNQNNDQVKPSKMLNCTARPPHQLTVLAGDEIHQMKNLGQLSFQHSCERGMIVDGSTQCAVWMRLLNVCGVNVLPTKAAMGKNAAKRSVLMNTKVSSNNVTVVLLEPPFVPSVISEGVDRILFRELGVGRVVRVLGGSMAALRYLEQDSGGENGKVDDNQEVVTWVNDGTRCCCVVDSGYSFTHVIPTHNGVAVEKAIRRLDIGGKVLTNLLKEAVTYRQWNMMDEYHVVNDAKEQLCYISQQFNKDMKHARQTRRGLREFDREFLLPDFVNTFKGTVQLPMPLQRMREMEEDKKQQQQLAMEKKRGERVDSGVDADDKEQKSEDATGAKDKIDESKEKKKKRKRKKPMEDTANEEDEQAEDESDPESDEETTQQRLQRLKQMRQLEQKRLEAESAERQALALSVERFTIPEVLFRPSDIGLDCGGIAEAIVESINGCDASLRAAMYHNVLLVGGNAKIPGFKERVEVELRQLAPVNYVVRVFLPEDPVSFAWEGAKLFSNQSGFQEKYSIDRLSWESMKKDGKDQKEIWGDKMK